ncbi:MAG: DUF2946 family protein [Ferrovum myxofaciens]|uniref:DUF2946 family protein n=1 Tax=Ferrovum myxofaciens TaxID=416213 RepID=UPI0023555E04|nr:DUF2946 family protein [Ferrovum myxofaciens]QKE40153.1 MAG: DUF2946 family protein [Ferrovum myxofaciens]
MSPFLSPQRIQRLAGWLLWPLLFQMFLVVGALDPLLDRGTETGPALQVCTVSGQQWVKTASSSDHHHSSPSDSGHGHCSLCSSLALALPLDLSNPGLGLTLFRGQPLASREIHRFIAFRNFFLPYPNAPPVQA